MPDIFLPPSNRFRSSRRFLPPGCIFLPHLPSRLLPDRLSSRRIFPGRYTGIPVRIGTFPDAVCPSLFRQRNLTQINALSQTRSFLRLPSLIRAAACISFRCARTCCRSGPRRLLLLTIAFICMITCLGRTFLRCHSSSSSYFFTSSGKTTRLTRASVVPP